MAVIYLLSDRPGLGTGLGTWDLVLRKLAHMAEFGLLWFLWWRVGDRRTVWPAALIAVLYAISDEVHQTYVRDRHGSPLDVLIDATGIAIAIALTRHLSARATSPRSPDPGSFRS
jgi:VanZ family protein